VFSTVPHDMTYSLCVQSVVDGTEYTEQVIDATTTHILLACRQIKTQVLIIRVAISEGMYECLHSAIQPYGCSFPHQ
jgi:predicted SpoU family rRNA methylase